MRLAQKEQTAGNTKPTQGPAVKPRNEEASLSMEVSSVECAPPPANKDNEQRSRSIKKVTESAARKYVSKRQPSSQSSLNRLKEYEDTINNDNTSNTSLTNGDKSQESKKKIAISPINTNVDQLIKVNTNNCNNNQSNKTGYL